ncbi:MAG: NTP transferase domain-containing protein [Oscillospiraceae bacterium]|nr:NTP transferase domain-containing protein [Oscillospiraceae bacterium]
MGVFKPLLPVGGEPAILRSVKTSIDAGVRDVIIVTGHRKIHDELGAYSTRVQLIHNADYLSGMFSSICAGVSKLPDDIDGFFVLPSDCCAVSSDEFKLLIEKFDKAVAIPVFDGKRGHPPLFPAPYITDILAYDGNDGLKGIRRQLPELEVQMPSCGTLLDMDTPEDYVSLLSFLDLPTYPSAAESFQLLAECETPKDIINHGRDVADLALKMAQLMAQKGVSPICRELLESSCLLHDIMRMHPNHAERAKVLLLEKGYPAAALIVGEHMDLDGPVTAIGERELLYLADKLSRRGKTVNIEDTRRELSAKFSTNTEALTCLNMRLNNAKAILALLQSNFGFGYEDIA